MVVSPLRLELPPVRADKALGLLPLRNLSHPQTISQHKPLQFTVTWRGLW